MKKYRVEFEFMCIDAGITDSKWHKDFLDNNGNGFKLSEAAIVACFLKANSVCYHRNIKIVEM